jgi:hypothetical protein
MAWVTSPSLRDDASPAAFKGAISRESSEGEICGVVAGLAWITFLSTDDDIEEESGENLKSFKD